MILKYNNYLKENSNINNENLIKKIIDDINNNINSNINLFLEIKNNIYYIIIDYNNLALNTYKIKGSDKIIKFIIKNNEIEFTFKKSTTLKIHNNNLYEKITLGMIIDFIKLDNSVVASKMKIYYSLDDNLNILLKEKYDISILFKYDILPKKFKDKYLYILNAKNFDLI